jgi:hypothetical protein
MHACLFAMEALRECLRYRRASVDDILRFARICRVENVMRPYVEAMVSLTPPPSTAASTAGCRPPQPTFFTSNSPWMRFFARRDQA